MLASALDEKIAGLKALDTILFSLDKPIDAFSIALFESIVEKVTINSTDRAEFTVKGGLRFTEPL